jgi:ribose 1,5-bisphosphokinase
VSGRLIAVVGPSGAGKDAVMDGLVAVCAGLHRAQRVITRPAGAGESFDPVSGAVFEARRAAGAFALHWRAHGHRYGIPVSELAPIEAGDDVIVNLSRTVLSEAARIAPALAVLVVTASPDIRAARIAGRGRERAEDIAGRIERAVTLPPLPDTVEVIDVANNGALADAISTARAALYPVRGIRAR